MATARKTAPRSKAKLAEDLSSVKNTLESRHDVDVTSAVAANVRKANVLDSVAHVTPQSIVNSIASVGMQIQDALDSTKNQMIGAAQELEALREAIAITKEQIEELHGKEVAAASIADLVAEYDRKAAEFAQQALTRQAELDKRIADQMRVEADRKAAVERERKREEDAYEYGVQQSRREEEDAFQQHMRQVRRDLDEATQVKSRAWQDREAALSAKEADYKAALARFETLPQEIAAASKKEAEAVKKALETEHKHQIEVMNANAASIRALADAEIRALKDKIAASDALIASLQTKLEAAERRVESIANSALESASGRKALEAASAMASTLKTDTARKG